VQTTLVDAPEWARVELGGAQLGDQRRTDRLIQVAAALDLGRIGDDGGRGVFVHSTLAPRPVNVVEVREINPPGGWTNRAVVRAIARLGGFLGRTGDGEPGWQTVWRGWRKLMWLVQGYDLAGAEKCG